MNPIFVKKLIKAQYDYVEKNFTYQTVKDEWKNAFEKCIENS
jgi:hypothetical protein